MRRLKLQMQITADGVVAGPEGQLDWMTWNMDESVKNFRKLCENEIAVLSVLDRKLPLLDYDVDIEEHLCFLLALPDEDFDRCPVTGRRFIEPAA